jgi:hypothetical protein
VPFGFSFGLGGSGWLCSDVKIYIDGRPIEIGKVDEYHSFNTQITVREQLGSPGWVDTLDGEVIHLIPADWSIMASCPGGPSRSAVFAVTGVAQVEPSTPPAVG